MERRLAIAALCLGILGANARAQGEAAAAPESPYAAWRFGPPTDPEFFPIGVWLQDPRHAARYRELGINTYVGLWQGPTEEQLSALEKTGMKVICAMNAVAQRHLDDPAIIAWMQHDEPDNAEANAWQRGPQVKPDEIRRRYAFMRGKDPHRPVWVNFGQGVANDDFKGRGARLSDYPEYIEGADILSFDCYPVANLPGRSDGADLLWYVAKGVARLRKWCDDEKIVWNLVECTPIRDPKLRATPAQVAAEVWMSLIHGSRGIVYFVHQFEPKMNTAALLSDPRMSASVRAINERILGLAPVLNTPTLAGEVAVESESPVAAIAKRAGDSLYVFAVGMRNRGTKASFSIDSLASLGQTLTAEVLDEAREVAVEAGRFEDRFGPYAVHLYRIGPLR